MKLGKHKDLNFNYSKTHEDPQSTQNKKSPFDNESMEKIAKGTIFHHLEHSQDFSDFLPSLGKTGKHTKVLKTGVVDRRRNLEPGNRRNSKPGRSYDGGDFGVSETRSRYIERSDGLREPHSLDIDPRRCKKVISSIFDV